MQTHPQRIDPLSLLDLALPMTISERIALQKLLSSSLSQHLAPKRLASLRSVLLLALVAGNKELKVLLADDDEDDRAFFIDALSEVAPKVRVDTVSDGEALLCKLRNGQPHPDLIFLDLNMPIKNGTECLEEIRNDTLLQNIPIIIYSTSSSIDHIDETYRQGANLYVRKPDTYADLKMIAKKLLSLDWSNLTRPPKDKFYFTIKSI